MASGTALYKALEKHPKVFDTLWVSLVQAGEMGGQLPKVLKQIGAYSAAQAELQGKIITALAYPGVLMTISLGVLAFFIVKIVPVFADIFASFNVEAAAADRGHHLRLQPPGPSPGRLISRGVVLWFAWSAYTSTEAGQETKWNMILGRPVLRRLHQEHPASSAC